MLDDEPRRPPSRARRPRRRSTERRPRPPAGGARRRRRARGRGGPGRRSAARGRPPGLDAPGRRACHLGDAAPLRRAARGRPPQRRRPPRRAAQPAHRVGRSRWSSRSRSPTASTSSSSSCWSSRCRSASRTAGSSPCRRRSPSSSTLKVCFWAAILVSLPVWLYQVYAFVIPAVQDQSRRRMLLIVARRRRRCSWAAWRSASSSCCPVALQFLLDFGGDAFQTEVRAGEYFGFVTTLMLGSGIMFEVPVAMLALARIGGDDRGLLRPPVARRDRGDRRPRGDPARRRPVLDAPADDPPDRPLRPRDRSWRKRFGGPPLWAREAWATPTTTSTTRRPRAPSRAGGAR